MLRSCSEPKALILTKGITVTTYTTEELLRGTGAFEQAMCVQTDIAGVASRMPAGVAIGILSSMMRSGLPATQINRMIDTGFAPNARFLKQVLEMYQGDSWDIHLWQLLPSGQYKVCTELCRLSRPAWRYTRDNGLTDF